jgi:hypothetical protein
VLNAKKCWILRYTYVIDRPGYCFVYDDRKRIIPVDVGSTKTVQELVTTTWFDTHDLWPPKTHDLFPWTFFDDDERPTKIDPAWVIHDHLFDGCLIFLLNRETVEEAWESLDKYAVRAFRAAHMRLMFSMAPRPDRD